MPPVRIVSLEQVASILNGIDLEEILTSQGKAFHSYSINETQTPQRPTLQTPYHSTLIMPARIDSLTSVVKLVSVPKQDSNNGLPGVTIVLDNLTGEPRGLVNARLLTAIRTAASSALATRAVFQVKENKDESLTLVLFGSGAQAKAHIQLLTHVLPRIRNVLICNRTLPRAQELLAELQPQYQNLTMVAYSTSTGESTSPIPGISSSDQDKGKDKDQLLKQIVQSADVICTCTNSRAPLFPGEWVRPGTHINMVGSYTPEMHEVDQALMKRALILVDARQECEKEAGELIFDQTAMPTEFKTATAGASGKDVTMFKSVGIAAQDVAITALVLDQAEAQDLGTVAEI
ncbi:hypothetical protein BGZ54_002158 [Gamsiella multidivaricata]|nr:hypothetical protein BGZ54_002158 [Gamsiella multidivaricata]